MSEVRFFSINPVIDPITGLEKEVETSVFEDRSEYDAAVDTAKQVPSGSTVTDTTSSTNSEDGVTVESSSTTTEWKDEDGASHTNQVQTTDKDEEDLSVSVEVMYWKHYFNNEIQIVIKTPDVNETSGIFV